MAALPAVVPHFFVRLTAICVERRELGVLREFILRAVASGFSSPADIAGFLGVQREEVDAELAELADQFFLQGNDAAAHVELMEKGRSAISKNGIPSVAIREIGCHFNGVTRRVEQVSGELLPKRRLPAGTLLLPALPARPPRIDELDVAGVKIAMSSTPSGLPRSLEVARLGRVVRTTSFFQLGHLLLRRGVHSVPMICVNGAADSELAQQLGAHPALQGLKSVLERSEKQVRHHLLQLRPKLKNRGTADTAVLRRTLTSFVAWSDSSEEKRAYAEREFSQAATELLQGSHWIGGPESQTLFAWALMNAKDRLIVVAPPSADFLGQDVFDKLREATRRGVKVELHVPTAEARFLLHDDAIRAVLKEVAIIDMNASSGWCGFCCDDNFAVVGSRKGNNSSMGRCEAFFGALVSKDQQPEQLLRDAAITSGAPVIVKSRKHQSPIPPK